MKGLFVNFSNHKLSVWSDEQKSAALTLVDDGDIVEIAFPSVDPYASEEDIRRIAKECVDEILALNPDAVMCQGEFGVSFCVISMLKSKGIKVVYACSARDTLEIQNEDGSSEKKSVFRFVKFREF